jgi:hypothetical protein
MMSAFFCVYETKMCHKKKHHHYIIFIYVYQTIGICVSARKLS